MISAEEALVLNLPAWKYPQTGFSSIIPSLGRNSKKNKALMQIVMRSISDSKHAFKC